MFRNYLLTAFRNLRKSSLSSIINILGLAIGMTAFVLIIQYIRFELSYDNFHESADRIFRIQQDRYDKGKLSTQWAAGASAVGHALYENFPEVENFTRFTGFSGVIFYGEKKFREEKLYAVDSSFFRVFSFHLIEGDKNNILKKPFEVVISESAARKYFGEEDPVGNSIRFNNEVEFQVTGIFEDVPANSHLKFDILASWETYVNLVGQEVNTAWMWDGFYNYIVLHPETDYKEFEAKIPPFVEEQIGEQLLEFNHQVIYNLQPLQDIHLNSNFMFEAEVNGNARSVYSLMVVAFFLVIIAWINYINLSTAKSLDRAREVGMRKVTGASRGQLINQFLSEAVLINLLGMILAVIIVQLIYPLFNQLTGRFIDYTLLNNAGFWGIIILLFIVGAFLSGSYPAFSLSSYKPASIIKGKFEKTKKGIKFRKGLVIFQFTASLILIAGTMTVYQQISFMQKYDLGVEIDNTLVLVGPSVNDSTYTETFNAFKSELLRNPDISEVATSTMIPGRQARWNAGGIRRISEDAADANQYRIIGIDYDFVDLYGLSILEGRNFSREYGNNSGTVLFNENAISLMEFPDFKSAMNEKIFFWGDTFSIVGVLKNYHQQGLKADPDPLIFRFFESVTAYYSLRINPEAIQNTLSYIREQWNIFFSDNPFEYFFLNDFYNEQYKDEMQFGKVFGLFAFLAIFIACLGLFGLSSYATLQRTKEIGIRKVLGSSVINSIFLLTRYFLFQVLIAIPIGLIVSYFIMHNWLQNFPYRISQGWWFFILPVFLVSIIAVVTVSSQVVKTANANPADTLRYE